MTGEILIAHRGETFRLPDVLHIPEGWPGGYVAIEQPRGTYRIEKWTEEGVKLEGFATMYTHHGAQAVVLGRVPERVIRQQEAGQEARR